MMRKRDVPPLTEVEDLVIDVLAQHAWGSVHAAAMKERERRDGEMRQAEAVKQAEVDSDSC